MIICQAMKMKHSIVLILCFGTVLCSFAADQTESKNDFILWRANHKKEYKLWKSLCTSITSGNVTGVKLSIRDGAEINREDETGWTPLMIAVQFHRDKIVDLLLKNNADVNHVLFTGWTPLYLAAENGGEADIVQLLIKNGANVNQTVNSTGWTSLHVAAEKGHEKIVSTLIKYGIDVSLATREGWTPLDLAEENHHQQVVEMLKKVIDPMKMCNFTNPDMIDDSAFALHIFAKNGNVTAAEEIIRNGADVNQDHKGWTPLNVAVWNRQEKVVDLLIRHGAIINCTLNTGWTPLDIAAEIGHQGIADMLIKHGAKIDRPMNITGRTPLHTAIENGNEGVVDLLIRTGANINVVTPEGLTPLDIAEMNDQTSIVKLLQAAVEEKQLSRGALWFLKLICVTIVIIIMIAGAGYLLIDKLRRSELAYRFAFW